MAHGNIIFHSILSVLGIRELHISSAKHTRLRLNEESLLILYQVTLQVVELIRGLNELLSLLQLLDYGLILLSHEVSADIGLILQDFVVARYVSEQVLALPPAASSFI